MEIKDYLYYIEEPMINLTAELRQHYQLKGFPATVEVTMANRRKFYFDFDDRTFTMQEEVFELVRLRGGQLIRIATNRFCKNLPI